MQADLTLRERYNIMKNGLLIEFKNSILQKEQKKILNRT